VIKTLCIAILLGSIGGFGAAAAVFFFMPDNTYVETALLYVMVAFMIGWISMAYFVFHLLRREQASSIRPAKMN
jgi:hypothetical protein